MGVVQTMVRISEIELKGFKNTQYGRIIMPSAGNKDHFSKTADILGIYGQNGSGKTAVIEAMEFVQTLLMGRPLSREVVHYISKDMETCTITVKFIIRTDSKKNMAEYSVQLKSISKSEFEIAHEALCSAAWTGEKFESKKTLIDYGLHSDGPTFTPKYRLEDLIRENDENKVNLSVAKKIARKDLVSFIFGPEGRGVFLSASEGASEDYAYIIQSLYQYAGMNLFVISNARAGAISMDFMIPFAFRLDLGERIAKGDLLIRLDEPSVISKEHFEMARKILHEMNVVLDAMIPGLSIGIYDFGEQLLERGEEGHRVELISKRGEITIPLKYESEGIIKIISVLNALMCVYNNASMCLIIDELDAGVYEYLLGELLSVFEKGAKGQLIFTSHNLRALEMINKSSIVFSTTNPSNRYIRLQNIKSNHNLRDMYLRSIVLGGQKEAIYEETDSVEIGRAFRRAGKAVRDGGQD
ncbi:AAA family ATPase [Lacrimispora sp.]|uniref:AAA family ATPase n=1 Tax=Lacrimispora sp. TaxID=2719234 RepID=UPI00289C9894|nr:AAA family ATPase [Lacrimispora sp.]